MLKDSLFRKRWLAYAVLGMGLLAAVFISLQVKQGIEQKAAREFAFVCDQITLKIQERLGAYALILRGGAALFAASNSVERKEWQAYVEGLQAEQSVSGIQGIGFAQVIPAGGLAAHIASIRKEGFPEYTVRPPGERAIYTSIVYLEPFSGRNLRAFGFDMYSEPVRRAAMDQARDTGQAALSGKVELVQETGAEVQAGVLMYIPVYRNGMRKDTASQRQVALIGWVYSPYRMNDLMAGILRDWVGQKGKTVALNIYDGLQPSPATLLFDSHPDNSLGLHLPFKQRRTIDFNGHQWQLVFDDIGNASSIDYTEAWAALAVGLAFIGLLFRLMLSLLNTRANAVRIADKLTEEIRHSHELLRESEFRWKFAIEGPGDGLLDWNLADNTVFFSQSWKKILGFTEDEVGNSLEDLTGRIHPEDLANAQATMRDYLNSKNPIYASEYRVRCKDGSYKWILDSGMVVARNEDGKPLRMIGTHRDITPRKLIEDELRDTTLKYQVLFENSREALMLLMPPSWQFVKANQATLQLFGASSQDEFITLGPQDLSPERQPDGRQSGEKAREMIATAMREGSHFFEWEHQRLGGQPFPANVLLTRMEVGSEQFLLATVRDISELKQAEAALTESRDLLQTIIDTAPIGVFWKDRNLRYLGCNKVFAKDAGMAHPTDVIGKDDYQMAWATQAKYYRADDQAVMESGIARLFYDAQHKSPSGQVIWLRSSKIPLRNQDNDVFGLLGVYDDITVRKQAEEKLRVSEERLGIITSSANDAIIMQDEAGDITFWNTTAERLFGYNREDVIGHNLHTLLTPARFREAHLKAFPYFQQTGQGAAIGKTVELVGLRKDGSEFPLELSLSAVQVDGAWHAIGIVRDITARKQSEEELLLAASVFTHAREGIMIAKPDGTIIDVNDAFCHITGYRREEVQGRNPSILNSARQEQEFYTTLWRDLTDKGQWSGEIWNRRKDGEVFAAMETIGAVRDIDGHIRHYVALLSDITPIKEYEKRLEHIAHFDALTNLPNRVLLTDRLRQGMAQTRRRGKRLAVAFIDLDGFKAINDNHGHKAGDLLLVAVASSMEQTLRAGDTIARLGGDEFVAVLIDLDDTETSLPMLGRLLAAAAQPVYAGDLVLQVSASLGATFYPQTEDIEADQLLRQADQAMYQAKLAGKNRYHIFDPEQDNRSRSLHESLEDIRRALAANQFVLYYQPKVNMRTGTMIGVEALIRWQHPEKGLLPPSVFLPVIEDDPLAIELGEWVIDAALRQMELWQAAGLHIPVSINIGARQLQQTNFVERLCALLEAHPNVSPGDLELEVLETSAMGDLAKVTHAIVAGRKLGVRFTLDDFGTGYSSLTYLNHLPVTQLKIDQRFIRGMLDDTDDMAILESVLGVAAAFRQQIIAEGVETVEHGTMLLQLGCELAQGYGIAHPMPANQIPDWSATWRPDPAWLGLPAVSRVDLPLLFASLEHGTWIAAVDAFLRGEREVPPPLDHRQCRLGTWLAADGQARHSAQPAFQAIEGLHRKVHALAGELLELQAQGRNLEAQARLGELHGLRDALLEQLKALAPGKPAIGGKGSLE